MARRKNRGRRNDKIVRPMPIRADLRASKTFRYIDQVGGTTFITRGTLLNMLFVNAASTTTSWRILEGIRVKRCSLYTLATSAAPTSTVVVEWLSENGPSVSYTDTSMGVSNAAMVTSTPPKDSLAGFWSISGTNENTVIIELVSNANDVLDIEVEMLFSDYQAASGAVSVVTSSVGVAGVLYYGYADGQTTGKHWKPTGFVSLL